VSASLIRRAGAHPSRPPFMGIGSSSQRFDEAKERQWSADIAEMRVRVAALDAETDHARWNLLLKKFVTLDPHLKNSSKSVFIRHHPNFALCSHEQSPVEPFEHFCGIAQGRSRKGSLSHWNALLPSLFIIGSVKAGSTSLWSHLVDATGRAILPGRLTSKGDISRKEKDFFGDPSMWRRGRHFYDRIWPRCPRRTSAPSIAIDATPAYHVWYDAPKNMVTYFGVAPSRHLRFVWMMRDPVDKFWSYFWELQSYKGRMPSMDFGTFLEPKLARVQECQSLDPSAPLWPPSLPPPFANCAPHLDHGLYEPQMRRCSSPLLATRAAPPSCSEMCYATQACLQPSPLRPSLACEAKASRTRRLAAVAKCCLAIEMRS
jgi:hypothetical protein